MVKRVKYGHVKVEDAGEVIRLHVGNVYRDLSVSYARILAGIIKNAADRLEQNLTQEELGKKVGVKRSQICKLESGKSSITLSTMSRVFQALGITTATLDLGIGGKVALW